MFPGKLWHIDSLTHTSNQTSFPNMYAPMCIFFFFFAFHVHLFSVLIIYNLNNLWLLNGNVILAIAITIHKEINSPWFGEKKTHWILNQFFSIGGNKNDRELCEKEFSLFEENDFHCAKKYTRKQGNPKKIYHLKYIRSFYVFFMLLRESERGR